MNIYTKNKALALIDVISKINLVSLSGDKELKNSNFKLNGESMPILIIKNNKCIELKIINKNNTLSALFKADNLIYSLSESEWSAENVSAVVLKLLK